MDERAELLNIVTVGHVDHGKSTVIGRLLADTGALPEGKLEAIRANCQRNSKPFEYAFLLDALKNEQAQGITIDTARCFFHSKKRNYIIIDAPGHIEFLKNMVTGASRAEAALMVIDASHGVEENTRRHGYFLSMLGIRQISVLVNKMDLVGYDKAVFDAIVAEFKEFLSQIGITPTSFIPVSGMEGDNIAEAHSENMPWYTGLTVLEQMDSFVPIAPPDKLPLRMPVQGVYKFTEGGDDRRIIAGTLEAGEVKAGDKIVFYPSGKKTTVKSLEVFSAATPEKFVAGQAAGFTMTEEIFVRRGEMACRQDETPPQVGVRLKANIFWLGKEPFTADRRYWFKCGTAKVEMRLEKIERIVNASNLECEDRQYTEKHEVAECILKLDRPCAFDLAGACDSTSRFVIVDGYEIAGGGIVTEAMEEEDYNKRNIRWSSDAMTAQERERLTGRKGLVVWMTGLSGSGKTTLAQEAERRLVQAGIPAYVLDGDKLRRGLNGDLGFSDADRTENMRRTGEVAALFGDAGNVVLVTLISPFRKGRDAARKVAQCGFMEVYVKADVETCAARDPKGLYKKAMEGKIPAFTGISSPYEAPVSPELVLDTMEHSEEECVQQLISAIETAVNASDKEL